MNNQPTETARKAASQAGARWYDYSNTNKFYRKNRPGESIGIYEATYNPEHDTMSNWRQTVYSHPHSGMMVL